MAWTFTAGTNDPVSGVFTYSATTDATSAAGTVNPGFVPRKVEVLDITNANKYEWNDQMADASLVKTVTAGTFTYATANGFTPVRPTGGSNVAGITFGTAVHTNSSTYKIVLYR